MQTTKQPLHGDSHAISSEQTDINFQNAFIVKGNTAQPQATRQTNPPVEKKFRSVKELTELVMTSSKILFGQNTFMVEIPKKGTAPFGNDFVPTGFLLDLSDFVKPRFYIIDVMLSEQSFWAYVLGRTTRYLSYIRKNETVEQLCELIGENKEVRKELLTKMKPADIYDYLKIGIIANYYVLLIMDGSMAELPLVKATYADTWQVVKPLLIQKYSSNGNTFCVMDPPFADIHVKESKARKRILAVPVTEEEHLQKSAAAVQEAYNKIKAEILKEDSGIQFNSQRYYIALKKEKNLAFFKIGRKRINLVVMLSEKETKTMIKHHEVIPLKDTVQKFYNGPSCSLVIENSEHLGEVVALLKKLVAV